MLGITKIRRSSKQFSEPAAQQVQYWSCLANKYCYAAIERTAFWQKIFRCLGFISAVHQTEQHPRQDSGKSLQCRHRKIPRDVNKTIWCHLICWEHGFFHTTRRSAESLRTAQAKRNIRPAVSRSRCCSRILRM